MHVRELSSAEAKEALGDALAEEGLLGGTLAGTESDNPDLVEERTQTHAPRRRVLAAALGLVLLASGCIGVAVTRSLSPSMQTASVEETTELGAMASVFEALSGMAQGLHQAVRLGDDVAESYQSVKGIAETFNLSAKSMGGIGQKMLNELQRGPKWRKELKEKFAKFEAMNSTERELVKQRLLARYNITSLDQLKPRAHGGLCESDEEELNWLCYKKCSLLTGGQFSFRISPFQCCQHEAPCPEHFTLDFRLCKGLDVSGDKIDGDCPHTPGVCLKNEELFGNYCYKRCAILTHGLLPSRTGPQTCCQKDKATDMFAVLDAVGCDTQPEYFTGGGEGDGDSGTPSEPHPPMTSLTRS